MKNWVLVLLFIFQACLSNAQWVQQSSSTNAALLAVDFSDINSGWAVGLGEFVSTTNGGTNWNLANLGPLTFYMYGTTAWDVETFSANKMIAVGNNSFSAAEIIFWTNDGGLSWDTLTWAPNSSFNAIEFATNNIGYIVGYNGHIVGSNDGGGSWNNVVSGTANDLFGIDFLNQDTGIIVGDNVILRTLNGGSSWSLDTTSNEFYDVQCLSNSVYIASGLDINNNRTLFKSIDFGLTWAVITQNTYGQSITGSIWALNEDTIYVPSNEFMYSFQNYYWHLYPNTQLANSNWNFEDITVEDDSIAYAVGTSGNIYKTTNLLGYKSLAKFSSNPIGATRCLNDSMYFMNQSEPSLTYEWYNNGSLFSNSYHASEIFLTLGLNAILLVVDNGNYRDSTTSNFFVQPQPTINPFNMLANNDSTCRGGTTAFTVLSSENGVSFQLYQDSVAIGVSQTGNGGNLNFTSGIIDSNSTYMIVGTSSGFCGAVQYFDDTLIYLYPRVDVQTQFTVNDSTLCLGDSLFVYIPNSVTNWTYVMYCNGVGCLSSNGNGGTLVLAKPNMNTTTFIQIRVTYPNLCIPDTLLKTMIIFMDSAVADITIAANTFVGDTVNIVNNSVGTSYQWSFQANISPPTTSLHTPFPMADSSYVYDSVLFIVTGLFGCADTFYTHINLFDTATQGTGSYCYLDTLPSQYGFFNTGVFLNDGGKVVLDQETDNFGNTYLCGYFKDVSNSSAGEVPDYFITKIDSSGNVVWDKFQTRALQILVGNGSYYSAPYEKSVIHAISTDCQGNIYAVGHTNARMMIFPDTIFDFDAMFGAANGANNRSFVVKFDSLGNTVWGLFSESGSGISDILYVNDQQIYFFQKNGDISGVFGLNMLFENGNFIIGGVVQINSDGHYIAKGADFAFANSTSANWAVNTHLMSPLGSSVNGTFLQAPKLHRLKNSNILVSFSFIDGLMYLDANSNTITYNGVLPFNHVVGVVNKNTLKYDDVFITHSIEPTENKFLNTRPKLVLDGNDNIYVGINYRTELRFDNPELYYKKILLNNGETFGNNPLNMAYLVKYDIQGNVLWHNSITSSELTDIEIADSNIYLLGNFVDVIGGSSQNNQAQAFNSTGKGMFISSHDLDGNLGWINVIDNTQNMYSHAMDVTPCGDIYFSGKAEDTIRFAGNTALSNGNLFVGKYSVNNNCAASTCQAFVGGSCSIDSTQYCKDDIINIYWCSYGNNGLLDIYYSLDTGQTNTSIIQNYSASNTIYNWGAPSNLYINQWIMITVINPNDSTINDTIWIYFNQPPNIVINGFMNDTVCSNSGLIPLPSATPAGGTYSGSGIAGNQFDPLLVTFGQHYIHYSYIDANGCGNTDSTGIFVQNCVGIDEFEILNAFRIYPNPTNGVFVVENMAGFLQSITISIYDISSRILLTKEMESEQKRTTIDLSSYSSGVYFVQFKTEKATIMKQIFIR